MAKLNLASMSAEELLDLRSQIDRQLSIQADKMRRQLDAIDGLDTARWAAGRSGRRLKSTKVPPKYRSKVDTSLTWSGRGAMPRWMVAEMRSSKFKKEDFLI